MQNNAAAFVMSRERQSGTARWSRTTPSAAERDEANRWGCDLCRIFTSGTNTSLLPPWLLDQRPIRMKRVVIGPEQAVAAHVGFDDISVTYFSRIPEQWVGAYPPRGYGDPDCELDLMRTWMKHCLNDHPECQIKNRSIGPRRLLDVRVDFSSKDIKLVEDLVSPGMQFPPFVCLSHCWGPQSSATKQTTKASIESHKRCIAFDQLSETFKDAVCTTRELGYRYLWIDSLCIIQDDTDDWTREAQKMPDIYGNSVVTLAALSSANGSQGCRTRADEIGTADVRRRIDVVRGHDQVRFFEKKAKYWYREYGDNPYKHESFGGTNPLRTRAWTLQERELPVRSIHFSNRMLLWQCQTMKGSSELPWCEIEPKDDFLPVLVHNEPGEDLRNKSVSTRSRWLSIVEDYTTRFMSRESDKLPAILVLATKVSEEVGSGQYVGGMFQAHLPSALMWRVKPRAGEGLTKVYSAFEPRRPKQKRAPSWSWAALDGAVTYDSLRLVFDLSLASRKYPAQSDFGLSCKLGFNTTQEVAESQEASEDTALYAKGRVVSFRAHPIEGKLPLPGEHMYLINADETVVGALYPDISQEVRSVRDVVCLEVRREPYSSVKTPPNCLLTSSSQLSGGEEEFDKYPMVMGLGLVPLLEERDVYQRIGMVRWLAKSIFDGVDAVKLTLV